MDARVVGTGDPGVGVRGRQRVRGGDGTTAEDELAQRISVRIFLQKRDNAKKRAGRTGQARTDAAW